MLGGLLHEQHRIVKLEDQQPEDGPQRIQFEVIEF
jgi:hypothetical protein